MTGPAQQTRMTQEPQPAPRTLKVALLGCGNVGSEVARILREDAAILAGRSGARLELTGIAVRDLDAPRAAAVDRSLLTTNAEALVQDADIVIELLGGMEPARTLMLAAMDNGASVVTGNKALLAADGPTLYERAEKAEVQLSFEAAVAGAIPILRPLRDSLAGDRITRVLGIVNGTTNYILDQMDSTGAQFNDALAEAQALGYAESDPTADIEGHDAAAKAAILASLSFHTRFGLENVHCEGITKVTAADIAAAKSAGYVIKLLAICERLGADSSATEAGRRGDGVSVRVHPTLLPRTHPLATVRGAFNAVFVEAAAAGELMFYGQGAGGTPTASAILGDVVSAARRRVAGGPGRTENPTEQLPALGMDAVTTSYYIGMDVADEPGVLAKIAQVFADHGVSIENMRQTVHMDRTPSHEPAPADGAELRIVTHRASDAALAATVKDVEALEVIRAVTSVLRVEGI